MTVGSTGRIRSGFEGVGTPCRPGPSIRPAHGERGARDDRGARDERGATLIELLVVVALIGIATWVGSSFVSASWQRSKIESFAGETRTFLQTAFTAAGDRRAPAFIRLEPGVRRLRLCADAACATEISSLAIPAFVSLSTVRPAEVQSNWPVSGGGTPPDRALCCDTIGRTVEPASGRQVTDVQTLVLTHTSMVDGSLQPRFRYTVQVFPIWQVQVDRARF